VCFLHSCGMRGSGHAEGTDLCCQALGATCGQAACVVLGQSCCCLDRSSALQGSRHKAGKAQALQ
jgi:hypothetical protein